MYYSLWSGEVQGTQEVLMEKFYIDPTFGNACIALTSSLALRSDFKFYKKKGMVTGELLPFDWRLVGNLFTGIKNSVKMKLEVSTRS